MVHAPARSSYDHSPIPTTSTSRRSTLRWWLLWPSLSIHGGAIGDHRRCVAPRCTVEIVTLPQSRTLGLSLGIIFVLFGVVEVIAHRNDTAGALAFWGLSLLGGGAFVLAGTLMRRTRRAWGLTLLTIGTVVATNATLWTLLVPIFAVVTVIAAYRDHGTEARAEAARLPE